MEIPRIIQICFVAFSITLTAADPLLTMNIETVDVKNFPNEIVKDFTAKVHQRDPQNAITLSADFMKEVPADTTLAFKLVMNGVNLPDYTTAFCDSFKDLIIAKSIVAAGEPKKKFPKRCPVRPGKYQIKEYEPYLKNVPPGLIIDGSFSAVVTVTAGDGTKMVEITASGSSTHLASLPIALPKFG